MYTIKPENGQFKATVYGITRKFLSPADALLWVANVTGRPLFKIVK